jgi:hypothetical protein
MIGTSEDKLLYTLSELFNALPAILSLLPPQLNIFPKISTLRYIKVCITNALHNYSKLAANEACCCTPDLLGTALTAFLGT